MFLGAVPQFTGSLFSFQFPPVFDGKQTSLVVSPLISLMEDQVLGLRMANIPACFLKSSSQASAAEEADKLAAGSYRVVYATPEYLDVALDRYRKLHLACLKESGNSTNAVIYDMN